MEWKYIGVVVLAVVLGSIHWLFTNSRGERVYPVRTSIGPHLSQFTAMSTMALCIQNHQDTVAIGAFFLLLVLLALQVHVMRVQADRTRRRIKDMLAGCEIEKKIWEEVGQNIIDIDFSPAADTQESEKMDKRLMYLQLLKDHGKGKEGCLCNESGELNHLLLLVPKRKTSWAGYLLTTIGMMVISFMVAYHLGGGDLCIF